MKKQECMCELSGKRSRKTDSPELAGWDGRLTAPPPTELDDIVIERCVVFRDQDWGDGPFGENDLYAAVDDEGILLMCGHRMVEITENIVLQPDEARAVAKMLLAAADEMEAQS